MQSMRRGEICGVISFAHIESASVRLHALDRRRHQDIRVGISVAVGVCRKVIWEQIASYLDVLRNRFAVISSYTRRKILWSLDASRSRLDGETRDRDRRPGSSRVCIQGFLANEYSLRRIARKNATLFHISPSLAPLFSR